MRQMTVSKKFWDDYLFSSKALCGMAVFLRYNLALLGWRRLQIKNFQHDAPFIRSLYDFN